MLSQFFVFSDIGQTFLGCVAGTDAKRKDDNKNTNKNTFFVNYSLPPPRDSLLPVHCFS